MKKSLLAATALGLFALTPSAFADREHHPGDKSDQQAAAGHQSGKPAGGPGHSQARAQTHFGAGAAVAAHAPTPTPDRTRHVAVVDHTRDAATLGGQHRPTFTGNMRAATIDNGPKAVTADRARRVPTADHTRAATTFGGQHRPAFTGNTRAATIDNGHKPAKVDRTRDVVRTDHGPRAASTNRTADVSSLRRNVQAAHRFHTGAYRPPHNYVSRHWAYGERLPASYFARNYWITDYLIYSLFAPPSDYVWVRVGDDALLVDEYSGEIVQVDYGVFY